ncbi:MAG: DNA cytosine methyltransferase [Thermoplasmata archaeon]|nr:DNA cytosine methyltransferase [Thermoplasmata archaeon]
MKDIAPKFIDLFCGAGGFSEGFEKAGFEGVFAVDNWHDAVITYRYNHPAIPVIEDNICKIDADDMLSRFNAKSEVDVIVGGPPCQGFSMAGNRNVGDVRNGLFREFVKFVDAVHPRFLVMENVIGLLSMKTCNGGEVIQQIEEKFSGIGYQISYRILNAAEYGVPQARRRVIVVANSLGLHNGILFPKPTHGPNSKSKKPFVTVRDAIMDIARVTDDKDEWNHNPMKHCERVRKRFELMPKKSDLAFDQSFLPKNLRRTAFAHNCRRLVLDAPSVTLVPGHYAFPLHPVLPRTITVREAARLQTFHDNYRFFGKRDNQALLVGNAVPVRLAEAIAGRIRNFI